MKLGWLVWRYEDDPLPMLYQDGDEPAWVFRKVRIVYAEISE